MIINHGRISHSACLLFTLAFFSRSYRGPKTSFLETVNNRMKLRRSQNTLSPRFPQFRQMLSSAACCRGLNPLLFFRHATALPLQLQPLAHSTRNAWSSNNRQPCIFCHAVLLSNGSGEFSSFCETDWPFFEMSESHFYEVRILRPDIAVIFHLLASCPFPQDR